MLAVAVGGFERAEDNFARVVAEGTAGVVTGLADNFGCVSDVI
jgi:hypothetical protein